MRPGADASGGRGGAVARSPRPEVLRSPRPEVAQWLRRRSLSGRGRRSLGGRGGYGPARFAHGCRASRRVSRRFSPMPSTSRSSSSERSLRAPCGTRRCARRGSARSRRSRRAARGGGPGWASATTAALAGGSRPRRSRPLRSHRHDYLLAVLSRAARFTPVRSAARAGRPPAPARPPRAPGRHSQEPGRAPHRPRARRSPVAPSAAASAGAPSAGAPSAGAPPGWAAPPPAGRRHRPRAHWRVSPSPPPREPQHAIPARTAATSQIAADLGEP